jgi:hypothetical protein
MCGSLLAMMAFVPALTPAPCDALGAATSQTVPSPDRTLRAVITPVGRERKESRVEIQNSDGKVLCPQDYSSPDGEHGLGVTEDRWTPDSEFFVYSTSSSGGHQPYHSPTYFYSRRTNRVSDIEELTHRMVVDQAPDSEFKIVPPHSVALVTSSNGLDNQDITTVDLYTGVVSRH